MAVEYECCETNFFIHILIIVFLVMFAGLMSGLTLGLMSMSLVDLEVLARSGTPKDRKHAGTILFLSFIFLRTRNRYFYLSVLAIFFSLISYSHIFGCLEFV